jgi:hypothetical protein
MQQETHLLALRSAHRPLIPCRCDNGSRGKLLTVRAIIDVVAVNNHVIRIIGNKDVPRAAVAGARNKNGNIRGFVSNWRARKDSNL